ncbi:MAG TPA: GNVR domain-containing protein [Candidatus Elarobacter sp.]|nr:GNVR domain-containing protein [Candidatus Elarobacter sp.]
MITAAAVGTLALAVLAAVVLPPVYRVTVSFAPNPTTSSKLSGAMGALGGLSGLSGSLGLGSSMEPTESPAFYAELLQSRELLTRLLLTRFSDPRVANSRDSARLVDIMKLKSNDPARRLELGVTALQKSLRTEADPRTNLVKLTVSEQYPALAAREANVTLALVNAFNLEQRASRAKSKRVYLAGRLDAAKTDLTVAQARYRDFLSGNRQWRSSPTLASDEETIRRNQEIASDAYISLEKQYEGARLDEFNDAALITVVDSAVTPVRPYWPRYSLLVPGALLLGLFVGIMIAGIATVYADWSRREPVAARKLGAALRGRSAPREAPPAVRRA